MKVTTIGIDLAKNVFQLHGVDERGHVVLRKRLRREQVAEFFAQQEPCLIGMEACAGAHFWARKLGSFGHTVRLMAPQFVKPYVKSNKNDAADAEAICEAVRRPNMRFVPVKTLEQQAVLALHRARQGLVKGRTAQANQIRGELAEFGLVLPQGTAQIRNRLPALMEVTVELPSAVRELVQRLLEHFKALDERIAEFEAQIKAWHKSNSVSQRLAQIPGVGPITASALVASVGDPKAFKSGRQLAAWLGVVPRQASSGGKSQLLGISKRGDVYLRTLLVHGARAVLCAAERKPNPDPWLARLLQRRHRNVVTVALANKIARIAWALLAHGREYELGYRPLKAAN